MAYEDLLKDTSESKDDGNYFLVTVTDLDLATQYPIQFRWKNKNGTLGSWSAVKYFTTLGATVPNDPQLQSADVVGGAGFIKVSWSGNDASGNPISNFDRVDVHISGTTFGDGGKPSGSFKSSGTQTFTASAGIYIVQLKVYSLNGTSSFFSTARTVTVTEIVEEIQTPVAPTGFTSERILGGIEVAWAGTYGSAWTGFEAINIYAGTSSSATGGTYIKVGQMTANKIANKIVVPVDGTYVRYGVPVYIHASSVNKNSTESAISANVTSQSSGARSAIGTDLADEIITSAKLVADSVTATKIATAAITETKIASDAVTSPKIIAGAITSAKIDALAITSDKIAANAITAGKILAGEIDVTKLSAGTISVNNLESGTLSATSFIRAGTAGSSRIEISSAAVSASSILAGFYIYNGATAVLQAPLGGGLNITGALTATSISTSSNNFSVDASGLLLAKSAEIRGTIKATSGYIGGETSGIYIASGAIQNDVDGSQFKLDSSGKARFGSATGNAIVINPTATNGGYYLYHTSGGDSGSASSAFSISTSGILTATGANFSGTITNSTSSDYWNSNGTFRFGGSNGITYNGATISMGSIVSMPAAQITGTITAGAVSITGSSSTTTISSTTGLITMSGVSGSGILMSGASSTQASLTPNLLQVQGNGYQGAFFMGDSLAGATTGTLIIDAGGIGTYLKNGSVLIQNSLSVGTVGTKGSYNTANDNIALIGVGGSSEIGRLYKVASVSSRKFKDNIEDVNNINYLNIVNSLRPVTFNYKPEIVEDPEVKVYGLIAEEVESITGAADMLVTYKDDEVYSVKYDRLPFVIIKAIQEMSARLDALEG